MIRDKIDLKNKKIVVIYMLYFGDMVSLTPFLEVLRREAEGSEISLVRPGAYGDESNLESGEENRTAAAGHPPRASRDIADILDGSGHEAEVLDGRSGDAV